MRKFLVVPGLTSNFAGGNFVAEEPHVEFRGVVIQGPMVYLRDPKVFWKLREQLQEEIETIKGPFNFGKYGPSHEYLEVGLEQLVKAVLGDTVSISVSRTGTWDGYGHGQETVRVQNPDGLLVEVKATSYCDGPGFSCSYSHGPWFKYGSWQEGQKMISAEAKLREIVKLFLVRKATFADLKKAVE